MMTLHDTTINGRDISTGWVFRHKKMRRCPTGRSRGTAGSAAAPVWAGAGTVFTQGKRRRFTPWGIAGIGSCSYTTIM